MATRSWIATGPRTDDITGVARLRVQLVSGEVSVEGHDADHVHLEVEEVVGNPLDVTQEGDRLTVGYPALGWDGWWKRLSSFRSDDYARVRVLVPRGTAVMVGTVSAQVRVGGVREDVRVATASAPVRTHGTRGSLDVKTASGPVEVADHDGPLSVSTAAGRVEVAGTLPRADVTTVTGSVVLETAARTSVVDLTTVSGAMDLRLPAGTGLSLTARSVTGAVVVDGIDRRAGTRPSTTTVQETTGEEACWLRTKTVSGALRVRRDRPSAVEAEPGA